MFFAVAWKLVPMSLSHRHILADRSYFQSAQAEGSRVRIETATLKPQILGVKEDDPVSSSKVRFAIHQKQLWTVRGQRRVNRAQS